jgi:hypothetical protein
LASYAASQASAETSQSATISPQCPSGNITLAHSSAILNAVKVLPLFFAPKNPRYFRIGDNPLGAHVKRG